MAVIFPFVGVIITMMAWSSYKPFPLLPAPLAPQPQDSFLLRLGKSAQLTLSPPGLYVYGSVAKRYFEARGQYCCPEAESRLCPFEHLPVDGVPPCGEPALIWVDPPTRTARDDATTAPAPEQETPAAFSWGNIAGTIGVMVSSGLLGLGDVLVKAHALEKERSRIGGKMRPIAQPRRVSVRFRHRVDPDTGLLEVAPERLENFPSQMFSRMSPAGMSIESATHAIRQRISSVSSLSEPSGQLIADCDTYLFAAMETPLPDSPPVEREA